MGVPEDISQKVGVSASIVRVFMTFSRPLRSTLRNFLSFQKERLAVDRITLLAKAKRGDVIGDRIDDIIDGLQEVMMPTENVLAVIPIDTLMRDTPELASVLRGISENVPIRIPSTVFLTIAGIGGFDFFEGITTYRDLRDKIDELKFRSARATSLSNYANTGINLVDAELDKLSKYILLIDTLDVNSV